jgi:S1-C subfamily serine protease
VLKSPSSNLQQKKQQSKTPKREQLPRGTQLGSGSGFVIDTTSSSYYIITNYHVVQRAYEANEMMEKYETFWNNLGKNVTRAIGSSVEGIVNRTLDLILRDGGMQTREEPARVFVRFGEDVNDGRKASFFPCEIVDVVKELDVAVLRIDASENGGESLPTVRGLNYGQSTDLLVGQTLLAIGNPFGLDKTITSGLVSALGRSVTGVAGEL